MAFILGETVKTVSNRRKTHLFALCGGGGRGGNAHKVVPQAFGQCRRSVWYNGFAGTGHGRFDLLPVSACLTDHTEEKCQRFRVEIFFLKKILPVL